MIQHTTFEAVGKTSCPLTEAINVTLGFKNRQVTGMRKKGYKAKNTLSGSKRVS
jgi:hypothetical protein